MLKIKKKDFALSLENTISEKQKGSQIDRPPIF